MFPKNIPLYKLDLSGKNPDNKVSQEYYRRLDLEHDIAFVMRSGPFYTESLILTKPDGTVLVEDEDYELFGIASELTAFVKDKEVGMLILMKNQKISEWFAEYQVVGHFSIINQDLVNMVNGAIDDDRPVLYKNIKNKPLWFKPELHQHDLRYEIHSFTDLIACIKRIKEVKSVLPDRNLVSMDQFHSVILSHIEAYEKMLLKYIEQHDSEDTPPYTNSHGLTAKQVNMELVDNFETATLLDILDGFRKDLHVTADLFKRAVDTIGKETESLVKLGTIPVLRYGSNSFIPSPVRGSYEGMGGNDFYFGTNIESNGDGLILMNRNDGRVNGLYFMENKTKNTASDSWAFTGYRYEHQTATADGVTLTKILRGSNGKFLVVGGPDQSNKIVWYYALGNGTLDPARHVLTRFPDAIQNLITADCSIITDMFPSRILLTKVISDRDVFESYKNIGFTVPADVNAISDLNGVYLPGTFMGQRMWEYELSSKSWRRVVFNYSQAYSTAKLTSELWVPYRTIIESVTADNPRSDGKDFKHGIKQASYIFSKLIECWVYRRFNDANFCKYDEDTDRLALKYFPTPYGYDQRASLWDDGTTSLGVIFKNRKISGSDVYYDLENRKGLVKPTYMDVTNEGGGTRDKLTGEQDHGDWIIKGWTGDVSNIWLKKGVIFCAGTSALGSLPMEIARADLNGLSSFENFDTFVNSAFETTTVDLYKYIETNPAGLTTTQHSTFWVQLDPNDKNSFGSVSYSTEGMVFRTQPALDANGNVTAPAKGFNLYARDGAGGKISYGYDLSNTTIDITHPYGEVFCTHVYANVANNRKSEYMKNLISHHAFPEELSEGRHTVSNSTASFLFKTEWSSQKDGTGYKFVPGKTYDLEDQIKNVLIPKLKTITSSTVDFDFSAMIRNHRIGYTNLAGTKYEKFLIFTAPSVDKNTGALYYIAVAFNLSGGTAGSDGIIKNATVTPVGDVRSSVMVTLSTASANAFMDEAATTTFDTSPIRVACRDLVMQLPNGASLVNMHMPGWFGVKGDSYVAGVAFMVTESGITNMVEKSAYYIPGTYRFTHHPYYGMVSRSFGSGPSELGYPLKDGTTFDFAYDYNKLVLGNSNYLESAFSIYFNTKQEVILNGRNYDLPASIYNLFNLTPDPRNKTFYVYLDYNGSGAYYHVSATPLAETPSRGLISIVRTNNDSIYEIENYNVFTMNSIRISAVKHGSVIPAATGSIEAQGQLEGWVTNNR